MAHVAKYKMPAVGPMARHYKREMDATRERENVDAARTQFNYEIGHGDLQETIERCVAEHNAHGRALRSDAVVMADWVITAPRDLPQEREREFFQNVHDFCVERYGAAAVPTGYVHMDEKSPHMHQPIVPYNETTGRMQASKMINRADLNTFHKDLGNYIERQMGCRYSVELTQEQRDERAGKYVGLDEYKEARNQVNRAQAELADVQARLEEVRRADQDARARVSELRGRADAARERYEREVEKRAEALSGGFGGRDLGEALAACREAGERERAAAARGRELGEEKGQLAAAVEQIGARVRELGARADGLRARIANVGRAVGTAFERMNNRILDIQHGVGEWMREHGIGREHMELGREVEVEVERDWGVERGR